MKGKTMKTATNLERSLARAIAADREWFKKHPNATVRFRAQADGEFSELTQHGHTIPTFIPSAFKPGSPLEGVAVIDLTRLIDGDQSQGQERIRIRLRTVTIRSRQHRENVAKELQRAIAKELITLISGITDSNIIRNQKNPQDELLAS
jgi:hypothetical protein